MNKNEVLKLSNNKLHQLRKKDLVEAVNLLKIELNNEMTKNNSVTLGVQTKEYKDQLSAATEHNEELRLKLIKLQKELKEQKGQSKETIKRLDAQMKLTYRAQDLVNDLKGRGLWARLLNTF